MNWLSDILPGIKKKKTRKDEKRATIPEGLWKKCVQCGATVYSSEMEKNSWVCLTCDYHERITAEQRAAILFDPQPAAEEIAVDVRVSGDIGLGDEKEYRQRLEKSQNGDARREAARVYRGYIKETLVVAVIFDFSFMGGSMGSVVGERFVRGVEEAAQQNCPFICFSASGGARMQEGMFSLLQMAKTTAALTTLTKLRLPYISVLTDPTTGGVAASFAMIGDIIIAEPDALVGFAGPRVIQETVREKLPKGFQRSEFLREKGAVDIIWDRREMRDNLAALLPLLNKKTA